MCAKAKSESKVIEFFQYETLEGRNVDGTPRESYTCKGYEKAKTVHQIADEVYGKLEPTEKGVC